MANVAAIGMMAVVISSFSVSVAAMLGGEEETPEYDDTSSSQENETETETETETENETETETETPIPAHTGEYEWKKKSFKKLTGGRFIKTLDGDDAKVGNCKNKCEKESNCTGITLTGSFGNKTCTLYSGDVSIAVAMNKNSHILRRL